MRVAIAGLGFMGLTHLKAWRAVAGAEVAAVASDDARALAGDLTASLGNLGGSGERFDFSATERFSDAIECARRADVDVVDICLPTRLHAPVARAALESGKDVLVEKPMALDGAECDTLLATAQRHGRILMAAHVLRFSPVYRPLLDGVAAGRFGRVRHALFRRRCAAPAWSAWMGDRAQSGGGVFDLLIHDFDIALACFGAPVAVSAWGTEELGRGIDLITAQLHYPGIESVTVTGGWHHPKAYPFSMEYTVSGDAGTLEFSSAGRPPAFYSADGAERVEPLDPVDGYAAEIAYFADCVRQRREPERCPARSSAAAVKLTRLAAMARARRGEPVPCEL
jgi:predicted dehydrogenase